MCGILAIFGSEGNADAARLEAIKQAAKIRHRGPDWSGCHVAGSTIICHERLAIISPDSGDQPLFYGPNKEFVLAVGVLACCSGAKDDDQRHTVSALCGACRNHTSFAAQASQHKLRSH